ncbi:unnamed protein product [Sphagnum troendelagicum]
MRAGSNIATTPFTNIQDFFIKKKRYQKKCCRGMDPMTFTRPVHSMRGTMTFVKLLNSALSSSLQHYECSAPTSTRQLCSLGNGIYQEDNAFLKLM